MRVWKAMPLVAPTKRETWPEVVVLKAELEACTALRLTISGWLFGVCCW